MSRLCVGDELVVGWWVWGGLGRGERCVSGGSQVLEWVRACEKGRMRWCWGGVVVVGAQRVRVVGVRLSHKHI